MSWSYILSEWLLPVFLKLYGETLCCFRFSKTSWDRHEF